VSRCRADSFYLAPGEYRSFERWSVHTKLNGEWLEITHRSTVAELENTGSWDGLCYVTIRNRGGRDIQDIIDRDPDRVEMWMLDSRSVNGKPDKGGRHHLSKVAKRGVKRCGGAMEAVGKLLGSGPHAKDTVRWFSEENVSPSAQASLLRLLKSGQSVLSERGMQSLVGRLRKHDHSVPMPEFDCNTLLDLSFLERYDEDRRVRLLESLWLDRLSSAVRSHVSVCGNIRWRGGDSRELADSALRRVAKIFPEYIAEGLSEGTIECGGQDDPVMSADIAKLVLRKKRDAHLVLLHPEVQDPGSVAEFIKDRKMMERDLLVSYGSLSEEVAEAALQALRDTKSLSMTHSVTRCENNIRIIVAAGGDNRMLEAAFAAWVRCPGSLSEWRKLDTDRMFRGVKLDLDARCAELMYKRQLEVARVAYRRGDNDMIKSESAYMSDELMALLESSPNAPQGVRDSAREHLRGVGRIIRNDDGVLTSWNDIVENRVVDPARVGELVGAFETVVQRRDHTPIGAGMLYRVLHNSPNREHAGAVIKSFERELVARVEGSDSELMTYRRARALEEVNSHIRIARAVADAVFGEVSIETIMEHGKFNYQNPVFVAAWEHSARVSDEVRTAIVEETGDTDLSHLSFLRGGDVDIVGGRNGDDTTKAVQVKSMLHQRGEEIDWPEKPRKWSELPGVDHIPWDIAKESELFVEKRVLLDEKEYEVRVIDNMEDLQINASPMHMGNCTDSYAGAIRRGDCLMLSISRGGRTEINVSIERSSYDDNEWMITEAKLPRNKTLPVAVESELREQLTKILNKQ
jgi:hypothetical protein